MAGPRAPGHRTVDDVPITAEELYALSLVSDGIALKSEGGAQFFEELETKRRVYIDDPAEAPEGAKVEEGDRRGTFYRTEDVEAFEEAMEAVNERVREQGDYTDGQWDRAERMRDEYEARAGGVFEAIVGAADMPLGTKATHRVKSAPSMLEKAFDRDDASADDLDELGDVFGAKFVPDNVEQVREVADSLERNIEGELDLAEVEVDNKLDPDGDTYYRAVHIDFETEDGLSGEVQVKSEAMEDIIDIGHDTVYKNNAGLEEGVLDEVDDCLTAQMDALFGELDADPDDQCSEEARSAIQAVA